jgi:hypothetical protein
MRHFSLLEQNQVHLIRVSQPTSSMMLISIVDQTKPS